jgi:hypothetical protein
MFKTKPKFLDINDILDSATALSNVHSNKIDNKNIEHKPLIEETDNIVEDNKKQNKTINSKKIVSKKYDGQEIPWLF